MAMWMLSAAPAGYPLAAITEGGQHRGIWTIVAVAFMAFAFVVWAARRFK
jgi:hypothetical protein